MWSYEYQNHNNKFTIDFKSLIFILRYFKSNYNKFEIELCETLSLNSLFKSNYFGSKCNFSICKEKASSVIDRYKGGSSYGLMSISDEYN